MSVQQNSGNQEDATLLTITEASVIKSTVVSQEINQKTCKWRLKLMLASVSKPLIPLKVSLFLWFGACSVVLPFLEIILKRKGLQVAQISYIYMFFPIAMFLSSVVSGVIADKIGRSKPILLASILICITAGNGFLFIPSVISPHCENIQFRLKCEAEFSLKGQKCNVSDYQGCQIQCPYNSSFDCGPSKHPLWNLASNQTDVNPVDGYILNYIEGKNEAILPCHTTFRFLDQFQNQGTKESGNCTLFCWTKQRSEEETFCDPADNQLIVFCMSFIFVLVFTVSISNTYRMFDATVMSMVITYDSDFGRERIWSLLGASTLSVCSGYIIGLTAAEGEIGNYESAIYFFDATAFLTIIIAWNLDVPVDPPGKRMLKNFSNLLKKPDVLVFLLAVLLLGTCWSFSFLFSPLYLDSLGAPSLLVGLNRSLNSVFGLPFLLFSNFWAEKIGHRKLLVLGFVGHVVFYVGYSQLINPWWSLLLELTGILNYHLLWVAVIQYSHNLAPQGLVATLICSVGGIHFGLGKGTGSMLGGMSMSKYGGRNAYKIMAATAGTAGTLLALYLFIRHLSSKKKLIALPTNSERNQSSYEDLSRNDTGIDSMRTDEHDGILLPRVEERDQSSNEDLSMVDNNGNEENDGTLSQGVEKNPVKNEEFPKA